MSAAKTVVTMLVGMHFRPPAKAILASLPAGCQLILEPEDTNPYDEEAVRVLVDPTAIPEDQHSRLDEELPASGFDLLQVLSAGPVFLGYVPKSGGKPLQTALRTEPELVGNHEIREALLSPSHQGKLGFGVDGGPRVIVTTEDES